MKVKKDLGLLSEAKAAYAQLDDKNTHLLISAVKAGFPFSKFEELAARIPLSSLDWSRCLGMSLRTFQRYQKSRKSFDPIYAEKLMEISLLYNYGVEVFGDAVLFNKWMAIEHLQLQLQPPIAFLDSSFGIELLHNVLGRIEHGILA